MGKQAERKISELWTPNIDDLPIFKPAEVGSPFQIKTSIIEMVQDSPFTGKEDPNLHLRSFLQLCNTFKMEGIDDNQLRARLFPYSLTHKALQWFYTLEVSTVEKWESLVRAFIAKFYSPEKTQTLCSRITSFTQSTTETITEAFDRFNDYVLACPHHRYSQADLVMKFYDGLQASSRAIIDASTGGSIIDLTPTKAYALFKKVADNDAWASVGRTQLIPSMGKARSVQEEKRTEDMEAKINFLMRRMEKLEMESQLHTSKENASL
ncbi:unnamed protein product [Urochloa humidicola]